nr:hypothetical protein [Tanacetum cinerariifolium]
LFYNSEKNGTTQWLSHINSWSGYAVTRNVQEVYLNVHDSQGHVWYDDELLFNNSCITSMTIADCFFDPPNGGIHWDKLKSLCMVHVHLGEDVIANILLRSPALESLDLYNCYGFERIDVTSRSVKNLEFCKFATDPWRNDYMDTLEINAPYILPTKDWDKLEAQVKKEEKDEKLDGDAALNKFSPTYIKIQTTIQEGLCDNPLLSRMWQNWKRSGIEDGGRNPGINGNTNTTESAKPLLSATTSPTIRMAYDDISGRVLM